MELYLSDHPEDCDGCARGNCEIQAHGRDRSAPPRCATAGPSRATQVAHPQPIDESNPYFAFDDSSCIVCSRCVRACADIQGTFALTVEGRGFDSKISAGGTDFMSSECVSCGACVQACPTSALQEHSIVAARHADPLGRDHLRLLRRRLLVPRRGPGRRRRRHGRADDPVEGRRRQRGPQLRQGPVRLRLRRPQGPPAVADGARHDRRRVAQGLVGRGDRQGRRRASRPSRPSTASARSAASPRAGAPTRRCTSSRRWCGRRSATTTSTPARGSATPPPATASSRPSAPPPAPRTSARSRRPT